MPNLIRRLLEMVRFSHTIFALPFALSSAVLAWKTEPFRWPDLIGILLCMIFARSAAMSFNRIVDRRLDAENPRTQNRHLPAGTLSLSTVILFCLLTSLGFIAATFLFYFREPSNPWPMYLSLPVLVFICLYSLTKRFTILAHFWLGASLMLAPLAAWIAIQGMTDLLTPITMGLAVLFWVAGFDILYACQDTEFDQQKKLSSIPARFGVSKALRIALFSHFLMMLALIGLYFCNDHLGDVFLIGVGVICLLLLYEHSLVRPDDLSRVNQAFFQVNGIISIGLFVLVLLSR